MSMARGGDGSVAGDKAGRGEQLVYERANKPGAERYDDRAAKPAA